MNVNENQTNLTDYIANGYEKKGKIMFNTDYTRTVRLKVAK